MKLKLFYGVLAIIVTITLVMINRSSSDSGNPEGNGNSEFEDAGNNEVMNDLNWRPHEVENDEQAKKPKDYKTVTDKYLGITFEYDQVVEGDDLLGLVEHFAPKHLQKFEGTAVKFFVKDGALVLLQTEPNKFESISRVDEAMGFFNRKKIFQVSSTTSDYLQLNDAEKMKNLFDYLSSSGWYAGKFRGNVSKSMAFIEISPIEGGDKGNPNMVYLDENKSYPAYFLVESQGKAWPTDSARYLLYERELCIKREFKINAIIRNPEEPQINPFYFGLGTGLFIEEPTQAAIDKYGVLHPPAQPIGQ